MGHKHNKKILLIFYVIQLVCIIIILGFSNWKFGKRNQICIGVKKTHFHFGQINFNMFNVIRGLFFISRIKTI